MSMKRLCEIIIVGTVMLAVLFALPILGLNLFQPGQAKVFLAFWASKVLWLSILFSVASVLWIYKYNGVKSSLWTWLPPLVFAKGCSDEVKRNLVLVLVIAVLLGGGGALAMLLATPAG